MTITGKKMKILLRRDGTADVVLSYDGSYGAFYLPFQASDVVVTNYDAPRISLTFDLDRLEIRSANGELISDLDSKSDENEKAITPEDYLIAALKYLAQATGAETYTDKIRKSQWAMDQIEKYKRAVRNDG